MQLQILDAFGQHDELLARLQTVYTRWHAAHRQLEALSGEGVDHDSRVELLSYQLQEFESLGLEDGELEALDREHARLANASRLIQGGQQAIDMLGGDQENNGLDIVQQQAAELETLAQFDPRLGEVAGLLTTSAAQIQEAVKDLRHILDSLELDPARLDEVEQRLAALHDMARKHRVRPEELPGVMARLGDELDALQHMDESVRRLQADMDKAMQEYQDIAGKLSRKRKTAAGKLASKVTDNMQYLGMPGGQFEVLVAGTASPQPRRSGNDRIEFQVSANPGQPPRPLNKVASGGELSRISLAIQVVTAAGIRIPTLIFDEVDVGIGGGVAEIVGQQLQTLAANAQVICVTHLPQVAAQADHHCRVSKKTDGQATRISIHALGEDDRIQEIARMLGGVKITEQSRSHAAEMIRNARKGRKKAG
jgi:DNA repair protein RecN (Recombination protein N)